MMKSQVENCGQNTPMRIGGKNKTSLDSTSKWFEIHVKGHLNSTWSEWFEGLEVKLLENGEMILTGPIIDQAALMGVLNQLSRLNLTLLSVNKVES
jgi:hypothetical protein